MYFPLSKIGYDCLDILDRDFTSVTSKNLFRPSVFMLYSFHSTFFCQSVLSSPQSISLKTSFLPPCDTFNLPLVCDQESIILKFLGNIIRMEQDKRKLRNLLNHFWKTSHEIHEFTIKIRIGFFSKSNKNLTRNLLRCTSVLLHEAKIQN